MPIYTDKRSGRLYVQFDYKRQTHKQYLPKGASRQDAKRLETKMRSDAFFQVNGLAPVNEILFEDYAQEYLAHVKANLAPASYQKAEYVLIAAKPFLKGKTLRQIKPADIERFKTFRMNLWTTHGNNNKLGHPRKPATVWRELAVLSRLFTLAIRNDLCDSNPVSKIDKPRFDNVQDKVLGRDDEGRFLAAFDLQGQTARDVVMLVLRTGLSQNDALGLTDFNIDRKERLIKLTRGKTKYRYTIPINERAWEVIAPRLGKGLLFKSSKTGGKLLSVKTAIAGACRRARIEPVTIRDLRRTFATRLAEDGEDALTIAMLLGHRDLRMVHRYARTLETMRRAVENLDKPSSVLRSPITRFG